MERPAKADTNRLRKHDSALFLSQMSKGQRPEPQPTVAESYINLSMEDFERFDPEQSMRRHVEVGDEKKLKEIWIRPKLNLEKTGDHNYLIKVFPNGWYPTEDWPDVVETRKAFLREVEARVLMNAAETQGIAVMRRFYIPTTGVVTECKGPDLMSVIKRSPGIIMDLPTGRFFRSMKEDKWLTPKGQVNVIFGLAAQLELLWRRGLAKTSLDGWDFFVANHERPCIVNFHDVQRLEGETDATKEAVLRDSIFEYGHVCFIVATHNSKWTKDDPPWDKVGPVPKCLREMIEWCVTSGKRPTFMEILTKLKDAPREDLYDNISDEDYKKSQSYIKSTYETVERS